MPLPSPLNYDSWQDFASALINALGDGSADVVASGVVGTGGGSVPVPDPITDAPDGFQWVYYNGSLDQLFAGDSFLTAPDIVSPFQIDTQSLALASVDINILAANSVNSTKIVDLGIGGTDLADTIISTAKIIDLSVLNAKIGNATILSAKIGDAQIISAKINDLAVGTAKIDDLAVNNAKVANLAVDQAKIALLAVGAANIIAASIQTAKIVDLNVTGAKIANATILTANIGSAQITNALIAAATILTANIGSAQIVSALIGAAQILTAAIADANITGAKIQDGQITTAKIGDAQITSAKIATLVIDKVTAGTLNAVIDMGTGLIRFAIGASRLTIGKGFGTTSQFFMWFGPNMAESSMNESNAVFYLKTNGDAYFGGSILAGTLTNSATASANSATLDVPLGPFGTNGGQRVYTAGYSYTQSMTLTGEADQPSAGSATIAIEKWNGASWVQVAAQTFGGSITNYNPYTPPSGPNGSATQNISGSLQYTDNSGGLTDIQVRARITARSDMGYGSTTSGITRSQRLSIQSVEQ